MNKIQNFTIIATIIGLFYFDFTAINIGLTIVSFYVYSILGFSMTLHRYYTHKTFKMNFIFHWFFTFIAILTGRGSPLSWVYIHRLHHAFGDTDKDPHPSGFNLFWVKPIELKTKTNAFLVKELVTPAQLFIHKYYLLIIISWLLILGSIDLYLVYFTWILPIFCIHLSQSCFIYFAHRSGYRNFDTKDKSTNNIWLWPFILGEAWHNNHHANTEKITTKINRYEYDPVTMVINLIKK